MFKYLLALATVLAATPALAQDGPTLQRIVSTKTFNIAYRDSSVPFSYLDTSGKPIGYSIDICVRIADAIKATFKMDTLNVRFVPITPQTRIPLIANGTADVECGSSAITLSRYKQVDFLTPIFITGSKIMVKKGSGINSLDDLSGKVLTAIPGTTNEQAAMADIQKKHLNVQILRAKDHAQAMLNLEQGRADAYVADDIDLYGIRSTSPNGGDYEVVGPFFSYDPYSFIIPKNDDDFRAFADGVISHLITSGDINKMYTKWFTPGPTNINVPMSDLTKVALQLGAFAD
jgi:glutamate/aspartate transport system substrate-binding protein